MQHSAVKISKQLNAEYWAVSSKTGENITSMFYRIAGLSFNEYIKKEIQPNDITSKEIVGSDVVCKYTADAGI